MINIEKISLEAINKSSKNTLVEHLGIEIIEVTEDYIIGKMPVDKRTHQPFGLLHGGASVVLAESLGSLGANLVIDTNKFYCVGLDINANHVRGVRTGFVYGKATLLHAGRTTQVWQIKITNKEEKLVCISRLTMAVVPHKKS